VKRTAQRKESEQPFQLWPRRRLDEIPVRIFLSPGVLRQFDELHRNIPRARHAEAEEELNIQLRLAVWRYYSVTGWRNLGVDTSTYQAELQKPRLKLVGEADDEQTAGAPR
jgi:hypothetical protein